MLAALAVACLLVVSLSAPAIASARSETATSDYDRPTYVYDHAANLASGTVAVVDRSPAVERPFAEVPGPSLALSAELNAPRALSSADAADLVRGANPVGAALKSDPFHRAGSFVVDDIASNGSVFRIVGGDGAQRTLVQVPGEVNGIAGRFEWIVDDVGNLTHQLFVKGGSINGVPVRP